MSLARPRKGLLGNILLLVGSVLCALLLGEVVLGLLEPKQMRVHHRGFYEHDPLLGWKKKANARRVNVTKEFRAVEFTNSKGIRGGEYSYAKRPTECRVLVLGDSFAEGYSVNFEELFSEILKSRLNRGSDKAYYEVINAGTVGYGTDQEYLFYRDEGYKYQPDLVIVMFYENDVIDNITRREIYGNFKPLLRMEDQGLVLEKSPPPGELPAEQPEMTTEESDSNQWLETHSRVYSLVAKSLARWGLASGETAREPSVPYDFRVLTKEPDAEIDHAWKLTEMLLIELKKAVESSGAHLLVFYVPSLHSVDAELWEATKKKYRMIGPQWESSQVESNLVRICNKHSIDCIANIARFKEKAKSLGKKANCFYYPRDAHWNIQGHKLAGEILADYIHSQLLGPRFSGQSFRYPERVEPLEVDK